MPPPVPKIRIAGGIAARSDRAAIPNPNVPIANSVRRISAQLGADANKITNQILEDAAAADAVNAEKAYGQFQRQAQEKIAQLDPLSPTYLQDIQKAYDEARKNAVGSAQLATPEVLQQLERRITSISESAATIAAGARRTAVAREAKKVRAQARADLIEQIRNDPSGAEGYLNGHLSTAVRGTTPALEPVNAADGEDEADFAAATGAAVDGFIDQADFNAAGEVARTVKETDPDEGARLEQKVKAADINSQIQANLTTGSLLDRLETAAALGDDRIPGQTRRALKDKVIGKREFNSIMKKYKKGLKTRIEADRLAAKAAQSVAQGLGTTQEEADALWSKFRNTSTDGGLQEEELLSFLRQTKRAPTAIKDIIKRNEERGEPAALAQNAAILGALTDGGIGIEEFGIRSRLTFEFARMNGIDFSEAAQEVVKNAPKTEQEEKERLRPIKKKFSEVVEEDLEEIWEGAPPPHLAARYSEEVEAGFLMTGDLEASRATAMRRLKAEYGPTSVNATISGAEASGGQMRYPPEQVAMGLPRFKNADPDVLVEQVKKSMSKSLLAIGRAATGDPKASTLNVQPITDAETIKAIRQGREPTWAVRITRGGNIFTLNTRVGLPDAKEQEEMVRRQFELDKTSPFTDADLEEDPNASSEVSP